MTREERLDDLLTRDALRGLIMQYCWAIDRHDWVALGAVFHDDATVDYGSFHTGTAADFVATVPKAFRIYDRHMHSVTNSVFVVDGEGAQGECYFAAYAQTPPPEAQHYAFGGRYLDRFDRRHGVWRIAARTVAHDWLTITPLTEESRSAFASIGVMGRYDRSDASYSLVPAVRAVARAQNKRQAES